ncbi:MAG: hypothetical protein U0271_22110 [Polyangiaceae bacterium]
MALACDGVADLDTLSIEALERGMDVPHDGAIGFAVSVLELLERVHRTIDPKTGRPVCLGSFSLGNFLACDDGRFWVLGWGHPWTSAERTALLGDTPATFQAPEVAFGVPRPLARISPAPLSSSILCIAWGSCPTRSLLPFWAIQPRIGRSSQASSNSCRTRTH